MSAKYVESIVDTSGR